MPAVPLGLNAYKRADGFTPEAKLYNLYLEADGSGISPDKTLRLTRPGLMRQATYSGVVRGIDRWLKNNALMTVSGNTLYANNATAGTIGGAGIVPMVGTTFTYALLGGTMLYLYDGTTIATIDTPSDPFTDEPQTIRAIDQLNQYVLVFMSNGRFYWIVPGETEIDPFNFATAESSPDGGEAIVRVMDEVWLFGKSTTEPWQATGDADAPFQRVSGRVYERGCLDRDTARRFDNTVIWVADDGQVCRGGAVPQVVSDNALAERIRKRADAMSAWVFGMDGHEFYALRVPGQGTFMYDAQTQQWSQWGSLGSQTWRPWVGYDDGTGVICGDSVSAAVWSLSPLATDDGEVIEWAVSGIVPLMGKTPRNDSVSVGVGTPSDCTVSIRWRDGQDDYPAFYEDLTARAPFDVVNLYRLGQPLQPYRQIEVSGKTRVRLAGLMANEAWR